MRLYNVRDVRFRNVHVNAESGFATCDGDDCATFLRLSKYPYDNSIEDVNRGLFVREREFARLDIGSTSTPTGSGAGTPQPVNPGVSCAEARRRLRSARRRDDRFSRHALLRRPQLPAHLSLETGSGLGIVSNHPLDAINLAVDRSDNLLVLSSAGWDASVYSLNPNGPDGAVTRLEPQPAGTHAGASIAVPSVLWVNGEFKDQYDPASNQFPTLAELFAREVGTAPSPRVCVARWQPRAAARIACSIKARPIIADSASLTRSTLTATRSRNPARASMSVPRAKRGRIPRPSVQNGALHDLKHVCRARR